MADFSDIPDEAWIDVVAAVGWDESNELWPVLQKAVAAALPVLNTARPRLIFGDVPITERTPHGVWIADGPDPEPSLAVPCAGLSGCDDCRAYDDLRQHLVEQIIALDEQHQRETAEGFPGFYITNDDGYPALTYYPHEDEDGEHVKTADAGTSLDELVQAARKHAASLRGEQ